MRALFSCTIILLMVIHAGVSRADEDPREAAGAHYARGIELANKGLYDAALEQFNDAYAKSPHFAVLYNIGQAQIALGRPLEAIEALTKYLRDGAEKVPLSRREQVQAQIGLLESRLAELSITSDRPGASIRVDGRDVGRTPLFQPIRLAAGTHTITASLAEGGQVTRTVTIGEAERLPLDLAFGPAAAEAKPPTTSVLAPTTRTVPSEVPQPLLAHPEGPPGAGADSGQRKMLRRGAYTLAGLGVASGGAALGLYLANRGRYDDWRAGNAALQNDMAGSAAYRSQATADNSLATSLTSTNHAILGLSIASGVLVAAGATLFLVDRAHTHRNGELSFGWGGSSANVDWRLTW